MKTKGFLGVAVFIIAIVSTAHADVSTPWDITSVVVQKVREEAITTNIALDPTCDIHGTRPMSGPDLTDIEWDTIVNIGQKIWAIIEANKPVVNIGPMPVAYALPRGLECWNHLQGWQSPRVATYEVVYKNGFNMEVVKFRFRLQYTYGGGNAGKGKYLANVSVQPAEVNVVWGYTFNASVDVQQAVNLGSTDDPLAGLELNLKWQVKTVLKESDNSFHFFVQGDGVSQAHN